MAKTVFKLSRDGTNWITFPHLRVLSLKQTFEILDGENATRALNGAMKRDIIGTYYNYEIQVMPERTETGAKELNYLMFLVSTPRDYWYVNVPDDVYQSEHSYSSAHTNRTIKMYITSGEREMMKYDVNGVDYWTSLTLQFVSMDVARKK